MIEELSERYLLVPYDRRGELEVPTRTLMIVQVSKGYLLVP